MKMRCVYVVYVFLCAVARHTKVTYDITCCYDFSDARLVVVARQVRGGESTEVDTSLAQINSNPKYPQAYYDAANLDNPYKNDENVFAGY